jgi:transcriptional regulator with XRE-family HTH domain
MLGDRVRSRRVKLDLTQEQVAAASGLKQFHISRIESGDIKDVKGDTLRRLARALGCTTDYLVGMHEDEDDEEAPRRRVAVVA